MKNRLMIALLVTAACGGSTPDPDVAPDNAMTVDTVSGRVEMFGTDAMAYPLLRTEAGAVVRPMGSLTTEIGRVTGAVVRIWGSRQSTRPQDRLEVTGYTIVSVNGRPVHVGVLESAGGGFVLRGDRDWQLTSVPDRLASLVRAKIYVAGNAVDGVISVESWGVIRDP